MNRTASTVGAVALAKAVALALLLLSCNHEVIEWLWPAVETPTTEGPWQTPYDEPHRGEVEAPEKPRPLEKSTGKGGQRVRLTLKRLPKFRISKKP